jgi:beta-aspartyl-peptidase (threonine type)
MSKFTIALHGGSGTILKEQMTAELETAYLKGLQDWKKEKMPLML